jgi:hypothetical protein
VSIAECGGALPRRRDGRPLRACLENARCWLVLVLDFPPVFENENENENENEKEGGLGIFKTRSQGKTFNRRPAAS